MIKSRIIPVLLLRNGQLYKSYKYNQYKYIGDPLNTVKIFNEKKVDEIIIVDKSAREYGNINFDLLKKISYETNMPLCYAGGVNNVKDVEKLIKLGYEKVGLCTVAFNNPNLITECTNLFGSQSIVGIIDYKITGSFKKEYKVFVNNGNTKTNINIIDYALKLEKLGVGEIILSSIDRDGTRAGYDIENIEKIKNIISTPLTIVGGASSYEELILMEKMFPMTGLASSGLFVLQGKHQAVLINYPEKIKD